MQLAVPVGTHIPLTGLSLRTQRISPRLSMSGSNPKYFTSESRQKGVRRPFEGENSQTLTLLRRARKKRYFAELVVAA
jgi:hypothetical protein